MRKSTVICSLLSLCALLLVSCNAVDDDRIPNMAVNVSLADAGIWNSYGVAGFGSNRSFIYNTVPAGFPWKYNSATGFGGILLIEGMDPFSTVTAVPLAYDLACPVERSANVRVHVDPETYVAVCDQCHSTYDVTMQRGAPLSGEAMQGKYKYALKNYTVVPSGQGGYFITN